jgi:hypothetical protein
MADARRTAVTQPPERRQFARVAFDGAVELSQGQSRWRCTLVDISLKGALINLPAHCQLDPLAPFELTLALADDTRIRMTASLSHTEAQQIGVACTQIDVDSVSHLRRLIELNTGDPVAAERELHRLGQPV